MKREAGLWQNLHQDVPKDMDIDFHQNILMHPIGFPDFQWVSSITRLHDGSTSQHHRT